MILRQLLSQTNIFRVKIFQIYKKMQVVVVCENKNFIFPIFEIILLYFKSFNNSKQFIIVELVLRFYRNHFLKKESD